MRVRSVNTAESRPSTRMVLLLDDQTTRGGLDQRLCHLSSVLTIEFRCLAHLLGDLILV